MVFRFAHFAPVDANEMDVSTGRSSWKFIRVQKPQNLIASTEIVGS